jgi:hypothetical protein
MRFAPGRLLVDSRRAGRRAAQQCAGKKAPDIEAQKKIEQLQAQLAEFAT